jgi:mannosyl-3-phosphoglycerate phosphatase family protein
MFMRRDMDEFPKGPRSQLVIFTDLDGTLLDDQTYDFKPALPALKLIRSRKIPLIMVSSKTRAEIEFYRKELSVEDPFIVENGGAIYFPGSFPLPDEYSFEMADEYREVIIGTPLAVLSDRISELKEQFRLKSFSELPVEEIAALTGLSPEQAQGASAREFDETIVPENTVDEELLYKRALELGIDCVRGGRFLHLFCGGDKGKAVEVILNVYQEQGRMVTSIGIGDGRNDLPMLWAVDKAVVMRAPDGGYDKGLDHPDFMKAGGRGPGAWNRVVLHILGDLSL